MFIGLQRQVTNNVILFLARLSIKKAIDKSRAQYF